MKKNMKNIAIGFISCLALALILIPVDVDAAGNSKGSFKSLVDVDYAPDLEDAVEGTTLTINNKSGLKWKVYASAPNKAISDDDDVDYTYFFNKSNKDFKFYSSMDTFGDGVYTKNIDFNSDVEVVFVFITLDGDQEYEGKKYKQCKLKYNGSEVKLSDNCTGYYKSVVASNTSIGNTENIYDTEACDAMRVGRYYNDSSKTSANDIKAVQLDDYNNKMSAYFPFCYRQTAPVHFSGSYIREVRQAFIKYYNARTKFETTPRDNAGYDKFLQDLADYNEVKSAGLKNGVITNNVKTIVNNGSALVCKKDTKEEETKKYYATNKVVDNSFCTVTCTEKLSVTYSPPSAVKAGLCFQYQVTVKSIVKCKTEQKPGNPWPTNDIPDSNCKMGARCSGGTDQAGPTEEFDKCIKKCDGGKYSQKCIDKCYANVYEKAEVASTTTDDDNDVELMAKKTNEDKDPYETYKSKNDVKNRCYTKSKMLANANLDFCAEAFTKAKKAEPLGKYKKVGRNYSWKPNNRNYTTCNVYNNDSCRNSGQANSILNSIKRAAPYYLRNKAATKKLLNSFFGIGSGHNGWGERRYYVIDNDGIKRQYTASYKCSERCYFTKSNESNCPGDASDIEDKYTTDALDAKRKEIEECNTAEESNCSTTTATYTIGANKPDEYSLGTNKPGNEGKDTINRGSGDKIFAALDENDMENGVNGICYGIERPDWHYKTTISFPDSYINRKTGDIINTKTNPTGCQGNSEDGTGTCLVKKFYYCTPYNIKSVNAKWWEWKLLKKSEGTAPNPEKYNIHATVGYDKNDVEKGGFGKFGWKLKLDCFYAVYNCTDPKDPNCPKIDTPAASSVKDQCKGDGCTVLNNEVRIVDPKDPFNQNKNRTAATSSGVKTSKREIGFNWTKDAQIKFKDEELEKRGYTINPEDYLKEMQSIAEQGRIYDDSYVDFEITLDPQQLNELKKYANEKTVNAFEGKYTAVIDKKTKTQSLSIYESTLLNKYNPIKRSKKGYNNE